MLPGEKNPSSDTQVSPEHLVRGTMRLIVLPDVFLRLNRMVDDPHSTVNAIATLLGEDPALSARLLKIANSPFYAHAGRIGSLTRAVTLIGSRGLRDLVLASAVCGLFRRPDNSDFDRQAFWLHSLRTGLGSRLLGMHCGISEAEGLFVSGLLHDLGQLVILDKLPEMARETRWRAQDNGLPLHLLEQSVIGCDHAEVGAALMRQWRLPATLWEPVACHHNPAAATQAPLSAAIVHYADAMAHALPSTSSIDPAAVLADIAAQVAAPVRELMGVDARLLQEIHEEMQLQTGGVAELLGAA